MKKLFVLIVTLFSVVAFLSAQQPTDAEKITEGEIIIVVSNQTVQVATLWDQPDYEAQPFKLQHGSILIVKNTRNTKFNERTRMPWRDTVTILYKVYGKHGKTELIIQQEEFLRLRKKFYETRKNLEQYRKIEEEQRLILKFLK